jgi:hypothetical protein
MQTIYNSDNYCVVRFADTPDGEAFEILDKNMRREVYVGGALARAFQTKVHALMSSEPTLDEIDLFLSQFDGLMQQTVVLH